MITIYHHNRCSKSRLGVDYLEKKEVEFEIVNYFDKHFTFESLKDLITKLNIKPIELVRKNEKEWIDHFKGKDLKDIEIIEAMISYPKLIERPIVVNGNKAIIARPAEHIEKIL